MICMHPMTLPFEVTDICESVDYAKVKIAEWGGHCATSNQADFGSRAGPLSLAEVRHVFQTPGLRRIAGYTGQQNESSDQEKQFRAVGSGGNCALRANAGADRRHVNGRSDANLQAPALHINIALSTTPV